MKVFVSYRRADAQDFAGRLADRLRAAPGIDEVFLDVDDIAPGERFPDRLSRALAASDAVLVVIGPAWAGPRLFDDGDFVRAEVRAALETPARVVPVLANGAALPPPDALPEELGPLLGLNAISIRHGDFDRDVGHLVEALRGRGRAARRRSLWRAAASSLGGLVAGGLALLLVAMATHAATGRALDALLGGPGPVWALIAAALAAGAAAPHWLGRRR